ncbi:MAG: chemotaxis protein CheW [Phycisphaeraceae bacterium]
MSETATNPIEQGTATQQADQDLLQLVSFVVGAEEYAIPILAVQEINRMMDITRVPQSPAFVEGVINLRGKVIPVVDLRKRFGMPINDNTGDERIIVVEVQGETEARVIGFTVDKVNRVLRIGSDIVEPAPAMATGADSEYVLGVGKLDEGLLILLSLDKLFSQRELELAASATGTGDTATAQAA